MASRPTAPRFVPALAAAALACACASSPAERAARQGDRAALGGALAVELRAGSLSNAGAAAVAEVVAEREILTASGRDAVDRLARVGPCARELDGVLAARMREADDGGARAALLRIDDGRLDPQDARALASSRSAEAAVWRAVVARSWVGPDDGAARRRVFTDADPLVRREAVRAARQAADPRDFDALAEVARLDPEPIVRNEAVRAISALPPLRDPRAVDVLRDLWVGADDSVREDIAVAWASPALWAAGGRDALDRVVAAERGPGAIAAAAAVLRRADAARVSADSAAAKLAAAIVGGPRGERLQALALAPLDAADVREAVERAARDGDAAVRAAALARLVEGGASGAVSQLETLARPGASTAGVARLALAISGDRRVQAWLEQDLSAPAPEDRLAAATELAEMGVSARAAMLLADPDAAVRLRAACMMLSSAQRRSP